MKRFLRWLVENLIFGALLYAGLFLNVKGALNIAVAWGWLMAGLCIFISFSEEACASLVRTAPKPAWDGLKWVTELAIAGTFIWHDYIFLGVATVLARLFMLAAYVRGEKFLASIGDTP